MKSQMQLLLCSVLLLAVFSAPHVASAYYDPGVQRWISRDPISERAGQNLYTFVKNMPTKRVDRSGLYPYPGSDTREKIDCLRDCGWKKTRKAAALAKEALDETRKRFPNASGVDDYADAFRHCYWACLMAREVGAECAQRILEHHEAAGERRGEGERSREMDLQNGEAGLNLSDEKGDCGGLCQKALEDGSLVKGPSEL
jgi:hypothetical protein